MRWEFGVKAMVAALEDLRSIVCMKQAMKRALLVVCTRAVEMHISGYENDQGPFIGELRL